MRNTFFNTSLSSKTPLVGTAPSLFQITNIQLPQTFITKSGLGVNSVRKFNTTNGEKSTHDRYKPGVNQSVTDNNLVILRENVYLFPEKYTQ